MIAMDYGANEKLCLNDGAAYPVPHQLAKRLDKKRYKEEFKGLLPHQLFAKNLEILLSRDDVVTESATVGASGVEPELVREVVANAPHTLFTLSGRTVKNFCKDRNCQVESDADAAAILYHVAVTNPDALQVWRFVEPDEKLHRKHTSVRPWDKRKYQGALMDKYMARLPDYNSLPEQAKLIWGDGKDYQRSVVMPFLMAHDEDWAGSREGYERTIGLYGHGYPSFYRRATVVVMQGVAKRIANVRLIAEVTKPQRKQAWKIARLEIRRLYHLTK